MPAKYIGTMMQAGYIKWRAMDTSGTSDEGPEDQHLIINFIGRLSELPWVALKSYGYAIDLDALVTSKPDLFDKKWLRNKGCKKANIREISNNKYEIDIQL